MNWQALIISMLVTINNVEQGRSMLRRVERIALEVCGYGKVSDMIDSARTCVTVVSSAAVITKIYSWVALNVMSRAPK